MKTPLRLLLPALSLFACVLATAAPQVDATSATLSKSKDGAFAANLNLRASDTAAENLEVVFYGRRQSAAGEDFSIVILPDTQYYTQEINGGNMKMFESQIAWILLNAQKLNIAFVLHVGDITQDGDKLGDVEWIKAGPGALYKLEDPKLSGRPEGIPYCVCVGNHDRRKHDYAKERTVYFNKYFGIDHFKGKSYYGGSYRKSNNNNHYMLFEGGSEKFIVISLAFGNPTNDPQVVRWARRLLLKHPDRHAIFLTHYVMDPGMQGAFFTDGSAIYESMKDCKNLMLLIGGHITGEGRRKDVHNGNVVYSILKDFQAEPGGGSGYLSILTVSPRKNQIEAKTYSPYENKWRKGVDSNFTLDYDFGAKAEAFREIGRYTVQSGVNIKSTWAGLEPGNGYEWYAEITGGGKTTKTETRGFRLKAAPAKAANQ